MYFEPGKVYRRTSIHEQIKGQQQGGISTPKDEPKILLFSSPTGEAHGYVDEWTDDGYFLLTGEGQFGDMKFIRGNSAIRDHQEKGKELHLFFDAEQRSHVKYHGQLQYVDWEYFRSSDTNGDPRTAIRFTLEEVKQGKPSVSKQTHVPKKNVPPNSTERRGMVTSRVGQGYYRQEVLAKFGRKCAVLRTGPAEILIASHIVPWKDANDDERLNPDNGILLSPLFDALFDKHLISFEDTGEIVISSLLDQETRVTFSLVESAKIQTSPDMAPFLAQHRNRLRQ
jgi:5-methylcytosine-specific restriction protein A